MKIGIPLRPTLVLMPWGTSVPILIFLRFYIFVLRAHTGQTDGGRTDKQTERRTDRRKGKTRNACGLYGRVITKSDSTTISHIWAP